jgi:hypothetical protein
MKDYKPTHSTLNDFGGILPIGIWVVILREFKGGKVIVQDYNGDTWHGNKRDLILL